MGILIISCFVAVLISFLCSLTEAVLLTLTPARLQTLKDSGAVYAERWLNFKRHLPRTISAILILNTIAHTGGATVAGSAFDDVYGDKWVWLFSIIFTVIILLGTEILPKIIGVNYSYLLAPYIAVPLKILTKVLNPLLRISDLMAKFFSSSVDQSLINRQDIHSVVNLASSQNIIGVLQKEVMLRSSEMNLRKVQEIMLPIKQVSMFSSDIEIKDILINARKTMHTRYPVYSAKNTSQFLGYVNIKELALLETTAMKNMASEHVRPLYFISGGRFIDRIIKELIEIKIHMAMVKDQDNKVIGIVTLEDLLEEIVGDINDEFDY